MQLILFLLFLIHHSISSTCYTLTFTLDTIPVPRNLVYDIGLDGPAVNIARIADASPRASERECAATGWQVQEDTAASCASIGKLFTSRRFLTRLTGRKEGARVSRGATQRPTEELHFRHISRTMPRNWLARKRRPLADAGKERTQGGTGSTFAIDRTWIASGAPSERVYKCTPPPL